MSLRINTNVPAMTALRNLGLNNAELSGSVNRLSTGLRIVTAADDPAGLIMSEGMRAQLTGLDMAMRNTQDAVNMAKTAEGGLDEVHRLLRDIFGVAVQSANSAVVDQSQLAANQSMIRSTVQSIDRIANQTQWGSKRLLNGTAGVSANITNSAVLAGAQFGSTFNGMTVAEGNMTIARTTAATRETLDTSVVFASGNAVVPAGSFVVNGYTFTSNGTTTTVNQLVQAIAAQSDNTGVSATTYTNGAGVSVRLQATQPGSRFDVDFFDAVGLLHSTPNPAPTTAGADAAATVTLTVENPSGGTTTTSATFNGGRYAGQSGLYLTDSSGNSITLTEAGNATGAAAAMGVVTTGNVRFQIGANAEQSVAFGLPDTRPSKLGGGRVAGVDLSNLDVTTSTGAQNAIRVIQQAIDDVSRMRGELGSFQRSFLESTVRSLDVARENLSASQSQIRDADMATEISTYTKNQILQQSAMSVLGQANQLPQQVLGLLRQ